METTKNYHKLQLSRPSRSWSIFRCSYGISFWKLTGKRVTTCLENLEMSGNLTPVREMSGILLKIGEMSGNYQGKKSCQGKVA